MNTDDTLQGKTEPTASFSVTKCCMRTHPGKGYIQMPTGVILYRVYLGGRGPRGGIFPPKNWFAPPYMLIQGHHYYVICYIIFLMYICMPPTLYPFPLPSKQNPVVNSTMYMYNMFFYTQLLNIIAIDANSCCYYSPARANPICKHNIII